MDRELLREVLACLPEERTLFHYFKDRYALLLLARAAGHGRHVASLRDSCYAPLLQKPRVREALAAAGGGRVDGALCEAYWPADTMPFLLTVGAWGGRDRVWCQTSRVGYNLVLRLHFSEHHGQRFRRLVKPRGETMNYRGHPILRRRANGFYRDTLAWARIDVDFVRDEALIEEIQSDWASAVEWERRRLARCGRHSLWADGSAADVRAYIEQGFAPYARIWDEAMLAATLQFVERELGIGRIYYHQFATGNALKGLRGDCLPPRSLYTTLPRRFCLQPTDEAPAFLRADRFARRVLKKLRASARFYQLPPARHQGRPQDIGQMRAAAPSRSPGQAFSP